MEHEGAGNHDTRFFARLLARGRPRRVLELACGSGRLTFTLAAALPKGEIVGVDLSIDMLAQAATARDAAEPLVRDRVSLVEGDMRDYGDYRFVPVDRTSTYVVTVARRRRGYRGRRPMAVSISSAACT
jgi:tRNA1(Val) A37 N6-methylase TrmN6